MTLLHELLDLVLPSSCVTCRRPGPSWCGGCRPPSVPERAPTATGPPVYAAAAYDGELRTALLAYKERGHRALAAPLAGYLSDAVDVASRAELGPDVRHVALVPVPSTRAAARERGGDHLRRLSRLVGRQAQLPVLPALSVSGQVLDSAGLSAADRATNLSGQMTARPPAPSGPRQPVLVVDDIVTTGASITEAARALADAGWWVVGAAVIAAVRHHRQTDADSAYSDISVTHSADSLRLRLGSGA